MRAVKNMAELEIGQHCQVEDCGQLDFLPFICDGCSGCFCLLHRSQAAHNCSGANLKSEDVKPDHHKSFLCTYKGCEGRELVPVLCAYCEKHFCLRHRHQSDHECEKLEIPKPRMAATQQLVRDIVESKKGATASKRCRGAKNNETAAKVALMKLKMHACGDISLPQIRACLLKKKKYLTYKGVNYLNNGGGSETDGEAVAKHERKNIIMLKQHFSSTERIYFQVFLPKETKEKSKPMFFCSRWSIGKVIDSAASLAKLKNDNNRSAAKKLRLCHAASGEALPLDHSLASWINCKETPLYNGGNIILEYLDNSVQFLEDADSYLE